MAVSFYSVELSCHTKNMATTIVAAAAAIGIVLPELAYRYERRKSPITSGSNILPHEIFPGPKPNSPALFLIHGWPDDLSMFRPYAQELSKHYHCVNCTLPGYPSSVAAASGTVPHRNWGFGFDEITAVIKATIDLTCHEGQFGVTLITHDWGCLFAMMLVQEYPTLKLHKMINMDIGAFPGGVQPGVVLLCLAYQFPLNLFWLIPRSSWLTWLEARCMGRRHSNQGEQVSSLMNWPYRTLARELLTPGSHMKRVLGFRPRVNVPFLLLTSTDRPQALRFYNDKFAKLVCETSPQSRVELMHGGNHWFPQQQQYKTLLLVKKWLLEETRKGV